MADTKVLGESLLAMQAVTTGQILLSAVKDVSAYRNGRLTIRFGRSATTALTLPVGFNVQWATDADDDRGWNNYFPQNITTETVAAESEAVTGTVAAGATAVTMASTTNLTAGEWVSIVNTTPANSEIRQVLSVVANTSLGVDALVNAQTSATVYDQAQQIPLVLNLDTITRIRLLVDTVGVGQTIVCEAIFNAVQPGA
jgi:hypothetical protein